MQDSERSRFNAFGLRRVHVIPRLHGAYRARTRIFIRVTATKSYNNPSRNAPSAARINVISNE